MKNIPTKKEIKAAAKAYTMDMLDEEEFKENKDAVKAISDDFKAGADWAIKQFKARYWLTITPKKGL
jgi:hypothetical protein